MSPPLVASLVTVTPVTAAHHAAIAALQARAFSPGRFARTAYRVREGKPFSSPYCRVALLGEAVIASIRYTPVTIGGTSGALLLGPLAVDPRFEGQGVGRRLIRESLEAAKAGGVKLVLLVGDQPYYGRFGFEVVPPGRIEMPGPVNPARLLAVELEPGALVGFEGPVAAVA